MNEVNHNDCGYIQERDIIMLEIASYNESTKLSRCGCSDSDSPTSNWITKNMASMPKANETLFTESAVYDIKKIANRTMDDNITKETDEIIRSTLNRFIEEKFDDVIAERNFPKISEDLEKMISARFETMVIEFRNLMEKNVGAIQKVNTSMLYNEKILNRRLKAINEMVELNNDSEAYEFQLRMKSMEEQIRRIHDNTFKTVINKLVRIDHKMAKMYDLLSLSVSIMGSVERQVNESFDANLKEAVARYIRVEGDKSEIGASVTECASHFSYLHGERAIRKVVEGLDSEGFVYATTATEEYYKIKRIHSEDPNRSDNSWQPVACSMESYEQPITQSNNTSVTDAVAHFIRVKSELGTDIAKCVSQLRS